MTRKVFVTLMAKCDSLGITKDVGQTPQVMASHFGYDSYLITYNNGDDYEMWRSRYAPDITVKYLRKSGSNTEFRDEFRYIIKYAKSIDVLQMFHMSVQHLVCLWIYKILNPKGVSYLRADIDYPALKGHSKLAPWKKKVIHFLHKGTDIVSAESSITCNMYEELFGVRPICVPIGFVDVDDFDSSEIKKEKIIMTAGRLGTEQKATEVLLEAYARTKNTSDWKLILAGPIAEEFKGYIDEFKSRNPQMVNRIVFTGNITDKAELYDYMKRASIFAMPSRWGAAETVLVEALSRGCYLMMSDQIPPLEEYTKNGEFGMQVPVDDVDAWTRAIDTAVNDFEQINKKAELASKYGKDMFNWETILTALEEEINQQRLK